jgi:hypothetical protein
MLSNFVFCWKKNFLAELAENICQEPDHLFNVNAANQYTLRIVLTPRPTKVPVKRYSLDTKFSTVCAATTGLVEL